MAGLSDEPVRAFLAAQGVAASVNASLELAAAITAAVETGVASWPELAPAQVGFAAFLGERLPADADARATIEQLRTRAIGDLYIVFAALTGNDAAVALFDERYLCGLPGEIARRKHIRPDIAADTVQQMRLRLLVGPPPQLRGYSGTGALGSWLRITALRAAVRLGQQQRHHDDVDDHLTLADASADPALQYQRRLYQDEFRTVFADAVGCLTVRERNLLKHSVIYSASIDELGVIYRVHRATAARWLLQARERLVAETKRRLIDRLGIARAEYDSVMRVIESELDVSVARLLG